jgi:hypothetical protein
MHQDHLELDKPWPLQSPLSRLAPRIDTHPAYLASITTSVAALCTLLNGMWPVLSFAPLMLSVFMHVELLLLMILVNSEQMCSLCSLLAVYGKLMLSLAILRYHRSNCDAFLHLFVVIFFY